MHGLVRVGFIRLLDCLWLLRVESRVCHVVPPETSSLCDLGSARARSRSRSRSSTLEDAVVAGWLGPSCSEGKNRVGRSEWNSQSCRTDGPRRTRSDQEGLSNCAH